MKNILFLIIVSSVGNVFAGEKLAACNLSQRSIHMIYFHKKSPSSEMPDEFGISPNKTRMMPHTRTNPKEFELKINGTYCNGKIKISPDDKWLVFRELEPGKMSILQGDKVIGKVPFKSSK